MKSSWQSNGRSSHVWSNVVVRLFNLTILLSLFLQLLLFSLRWILLLKRRLMKVSPLIQSVPVTKFELWFHLFVFKNNLQNENSFMKIRFKMYIYYIHLTRVYTVLNFINDRSIIVTLFFQRRKSEIFPLNRHNHK